MTTSSALSAVGRSGATRLLVPAFIVLELAAGVIQGWINPLISVIGTQFQVPNGSLSWIFTASLLSSAVSVPLLTMLADRFGPRRLLVIALALTAAGSSMIALAPNFEFLVAGAIVQGPIAALIPIEMCLLKHHRRESANKIVGMLVGILVFGIAVGAISSGFVMDALHSFAATQLIGASPLIVLTLIIGFAIPRTPGDATRSVDWIGAGVLSIALIGIMYGLAEGSSAGWTSPLTLIPVLIGVVALVAFIVVEGRASTPLLDLKLLRRAGLRVPMILGLLIAMVMFGNMTPTVLYLSASPATVGYGVGVTAAMVGIIFAITAVFGTIGSFGAPQLARLIGQRLTIAIGCLVQAVALLLLATGPSDTIVAAGLFSLSSLGSGAALAVLPGIVIDRAPVTSAASVSGIYNTARTLGGSLAGALVASVMTAFMMAASGSASGGAGATPFAAFQVVWIVFAGLLILSAALSPLIGSTRKAAGPESGLADSVKTGVAA